ncbi:uncharacterized protein LOC109283116 isoform X1 [Alligator mississippiensis]|uniref:uncharacterized protein LOC109283116 isoform X1 n=1 Tax=Alligator mississippiensis TaxID=8496 RepID=UPI002877CC45|nr:uncharacterized protein LOC109283116 isoform X1 [Alligator mississippiensis]
MRSGRPSVVGRAGQRGGFYQDVGTRGCSKELHWSQCPAILLRPLPRGPVSLPGKPRTSMTSPLVSHSGASAPPRPRCRRVALATASVPRAAWEEPQPRESAMEQAGPPGPDVPAALGPEELAAAVSSTVACAAQALRAAGLAHKAAQVSRSQAGEALAQARLSYHQARRLGDGLGPAAAPRARRPPGPRSSEALRLAESVMLCPDAAAPSSTLTCPCCGTPASGAAWLAMSCRSLEQDDDDDEDDLEDDEDEEGLRGRDPSHHRQVEALRREDRLGGPYLTRRRRSPRRSASGLLEGLSPLVSEQDLSTIQGGTGKFLSQVTRREPPSPRAAHGNDPGDITRDPAAPEPSNSAEAGDQDDPGDVLDNDPGDPNAAEVTEPVAQ